MGEQQKAVPMNVCVIGGAGYVGLVTGLCLSEMGHQVINVDVDEERIHKLQAGQSPIRESGIELLLQRNRQSGHIRFSSDLPTAAATSDIVIISVGTPCLDDGQADLSQIIQVIEALEPCIDSYKLIVIKSTAPVGTVGLARSILSRHRQEGRDFDIVVNPEFLREGHGIHDFFHPDRIVVGASSEKARMLMRDLYCPVIQGLVNWEDPDQKRDRSVPVPLVETDPASAQMIKYASNAFLAARISFINEIAGLCEKVSADVKEVSRGMGFDPRIGHAYLEAGLGFGGPCLEKDLRALMTIAEDNSYETQLLSAILQRNERQLEQVMVKLRKLVGHVLCQKTVAVFGAAFKAGTDDVRNSLALKVIDRLETEGVAVRVHDPEARIPSLNVVFCEDPYEAVSDADALLILTEWPCFKELDYREIKTRMAHAAILDARNLLNAEALRQLGFTYVGIGHP
jgi:UDPglucose 6-dehydrogenase